MFFINRLIVSVMFHLLCYVHVRLLNCSIKISQKNQSIELKYNLEQSILAKMNGKLYWCFAMQRGNRLEGRW